MNQKVSNASPMKAAIAERAEQWRSVEAASGWPQEITFHTTLDLSADYGDPVLPENVIAAVERSLDEGKTHYTDRPGVPALREAVAEKLAEQDVFVEADGGVVISCGEREGVFVALEVLTQPGDEVLAPAPRPTFIDEAVRLAKGTVVSLPLSPEENFVLQAAQIEAAVTEKTRLLVLINPSKPTGVVIPPQEVERIAAVAEAHDLTIIADESLDESLTRNLRHKSVAAFREAADRTLIVGSFSYLHGLASWRVGYFAGPKSIVQPVRDLKQAMTICTSAMSQYAALEAMTGPQEWLHERRQVLDEKRALAYQALEDMGLPHSRSGASPYVFVDVSGTGHNAEAFADWLFDEIQVSVLPGSRFGSHGEGFVRLSLWPTVTELEQALRRMKWALNRAAGGAQ